MSPYWQEITWKFGFISNMLTWKNILVHLKKFCHLGTGSDCLWNIVFVGKIWILFDYISWCLIGHMTVWIRFVSTKDGLSEYILSAIWYFGHQCIFQWETCQKIAFFCDFEAWPLAVQMISHTVFLIFSLHFLPYLEHRNYNKSMLSAGHHKVSNFRNTFASHISCNSSWKEFFFEKWLYLDISKIISKNKENLSRSVLDFAWLLQILALKCKVQLFCC